MKKWKNGNRKEETKMKKKERVLMVTSDNSGKAREIE